MNNIYLSHNNIVSSLGFTSAKDLTVSRFEAIIANGFCFLCFPFRSLAKGSVLVVVVATWKPPLPLIAKIFYIEVVFISRGTR